MAKTKITPEQEKEYVLKLYENHKIKYKEFPTDKNRRILVDYIERINNWDAVIYNIQQVLIRIRSKQREEKNIEIIKGAI